MHNHLGSICLRAYWILAFSVISFVHFKVFCDAFSITCFYYYKTWAWDHACWPYNFQLVVPTVRHAVTSKSKQQIFQCCSQQFSMLHAPISPVVDPCPCLSHVFLQPQQFGLGILTWSSNYWFLALSRNFDSCFPFGLSDHGCLIRSPRLALVSRIPHQCCPPWMTPPCR